MRVKVIIVSLLIMLLFPIYSAHPTAGRNTSKDAAATINSQLISSSQISSTANGTNDSNANGLIIASIGVLGGILSTLLAIFIPRYSKERKRRKKERLRRTELALEAKLIMKNQKQTLSKREQKQTLPKRLEKYRHAIEQDPRIAKLQILDMTRPLNITSVYIQVRLHQVTERSYKLDTILQEAAVQQDPNSLLHAERKYLERRIALAQNPEEAIAQFKHCVIVGDPGAGKTTLLKYLTLKSASDQLRSLPQIPIYIELNAFTSSGYKDLLDFAAFIWETRYNFPHTDALRFINDCLEKGEAILLLDALDETVMGKSVEEADASYRHIANMIMDLAIRYNNSYIVVTVRKASYNQRMRLEGFAELDVLDFRPEDIKRFTLQWFLSHPQKEKQKLGDQLNTVLDRNLRLRALAANPLLLSLIAIVYEAQLDLPDRRSELYKQCVEILLTRWDASRNISRHREFKPEHKRQLLQEIAWYFHLRGQRYFAEDELLKIIAGFLPTIGVTADQTVSILEEIASVNGLIKEQARGWHGFLHLTLQEYFTAQYASDHNQLDQIIKARHQPWWEEVILLYAGQVPDASPLIQFLLENDQHMPIESRSEQNALNSDLMLLSRVLNSRPTIRNVNLREYAIKRLFQVLLQIPYSGVRQSIAESLVDISGKDVNTALLRLLTSEKSPVGVRQCIVYALIRQGKDYGNDTLTQLALNKNTDQSVSDVIHFGLMRMGEALSTNTLLQIVLDAYTKDDLILNGILSTLQTREGSQLIPVLRQKLADKHINIEPNVRIRVEKLLRNLQNAQNPKH